MWLNRMVVLGLLGAVALAGCNTTSAVVVPKAKPAARHAESPRPAQKGAVFALDALSTGIGSRQTVFSFPQQFEAPGLLCNYPLRGDQNISMIGAGQYLGDWENSMAKAVHREMGGRGYEMTGAPDAAFARARRGDAAEFLVAGRITRMTGNMCHAYNWFTGQLINKFGGELYVAVEWSVLNTLTDEVVLTETHDGYHKLMPPISEGVFFTFEGAFEDSIRKFAASPKLIALSEGTGTPPLVARTGAPIIVTAGAATAGFDINRAAPAVVTVKVGGGHGSGFFVGQDGYVLTNAHVVGAARRALVRTAAGVEATAEILRTDPVRDVALLKVDLPAPTALSIQTATPRPAETVYAIGSPIDEALSTTVTRGIVSANRTDKKTGLPFIQADAAISPGNSGGPLLDENGAIVGVAVAKFSGGGAEGVSLFIPIASALDSINVKLRGVAGS